MITQRMLITIATVLTASGGATPAVTGNPIPIGSSGDGMSLFLSNSGASTSLSVTYQIGFFNQAAQMDKLDNLTWCTPDDSGVMGSALTAIDINASYAHGSTGGLAPGKYYRFIVTNNDAVNGATVSLFGQYQFTSIG